jgi:hypothetical protein
VRDTTPPTIQLLGETEITLFKGQNFQEPGYEVKDNYDDTVVVKVDSTVNTNEIGSYQIKYYAVDSAGNQTEEFRSVEILPVGPRLVVDNYGYNYYPGAFEFPVTLAGGDQGVIGFQGTIVYDPSICAPTMVGSNMFVKYSVKDSQTGQPIMDHNNFHFVEPGKINFVWYDPGVRVHFLEGEVLFKLEFGFIDKNAGFTQFSIDSSSIISMVVTADENVNRVPDYSYDLYFNNDVFSPKIISNTGINKIEAGSVFELPIVTARDFAGRPLLVYSTGNIDPSRLGEQDLTYTTTDQYGNTGDKTVTFDVVDTTSPVASLIGEGVQLIEAGETFLDPGIIVSDLVDTNP